MIDKPEWASIRTLVEKVVGEIAGTRRDHIFLAKVIKNDPHNNLVWIADYGNTPIPLVGFNYEVKYYDDNGTSTQQKVAKVKIECPKVGQTILVMQEMGSRRLPRCVGVLQSKNFIVSDES